MTDQAALDARLQSIRAEMAGFGIGVHSHTIDALDRVERKVLSLEQGITMSPPVRNSSRSGDGPAFPMMQSPARDPHVVPARTILFSEMEEQRRLAALRAESESRIKRAEQDIREAERGIAESMQESALLKELHRKAAEEEALRTCCNLLTGSPGVVQPLQSPPPVYCATTMYSPPPMHTPAHAVPMAVPLPNVFPVSYVQPVGSPLVQIINNHSPLAQPAPPPAAPKDDIDAAVDKRVKELMTRARLKLSCGIELCDGVRDADPVAPSSKGTASPARLSRPLSESTQQRSEEAITRDYKASEGLAEIMRRQRELEDEPQLYASAASTKDVHHEAPVSMSDAHESQGVALEDVEEEVLAHESLGTREVALEDTQLSAQDAQLSAQDVCEEKGLDEVQTAGSCSEHADIDTQQSMTQVGVVVEPPTPSTCIEKFAPEESVLHESKPSARQASASPCGADEFVPDDRGSPTPSPFASHPENPSSQPHSNVVSDLVSQPLQHHSGLSYQSHQLHSQPQSDVRRNSTTSLVQEHSSVASVLNSEVSVRSRASRVSAADE